jgi:hypothetical protein
MRSERWHSDHSIVRAERDSAALAYCNRHRRDFSFALPARWPVQAAQSQVRSDINTAPEGSGGEALSLWPTSAIEGHLEFLPTDYNFAKRLKALRGLAPHEYICKIWIEQPKLFGLNPLHHMATSYT